MIGVEHCEWCGFDLEQWDEQDAERTLRHAASLLAGWCADAPPRLNEQLQARQVDDLKSIDAAVDLYDKVHHLWHGLVWIADLRRDVNDTVTRHSGTVTQLSRSDGGVPKSAIDTAHVGIRGVDGDRQHARAHHGRPWQALCLWSTEVIGSFVADGHPIGPGSAGENVTISGLDWGALRAGTILDIGAVRCQLSAPAVPCAKNAGWFTDGDISRIDHDLHPASSRWYASVLTPGDVATGDTVVVSPH